jgi:hypothetical protein
MPETDEFVAEAGQESARKKFRRFMVPLVVVAIMVLEGGGLFIVTKMMYGRPAASQAAENSPEAQLMNELENEVEIELPEVNAFNKREGRLYLYNLTVTIRVKTKDETEVRKIIEARGSTILDRLNTVIRSAEIKHLNEPGLDTIRRQFRFGDDQLIQEVLIPRFFQSPADV